MKFLHINNNNVKDINKYIKDGKHVFVLIYMEGCGPCNQVRPEWKKIENIFASKNNPKYNNVVIADIESEMMNNMKLINQPVGFPTMKYISNKGKHEENYEGGRDVNSFIEWINEKIKKRSSSNHTLKRKIHKGGKWTRKYKKSINCKKPKGFSQKQYCKYGRRK